MPTDSTHLPSEVVLELLDAASGRPVQTWRFLDSQRITIGREEDRHVSISDPVVSRYHAELRWSDGRWLLVSLGRNGVLVENQMIAEHTLISRTVFRLGASGPTLRFQPKSERDENQSTICFESEALVIYELDRDRLEKEVQEITEGPYFQSLQNMARKLRQRRQSDTRSC